MRLRIYIPIAFVPRCFLMAGRKAMATGLTPFRPPGILNLALCGSSSVVEHRLAKARVASSNLVFRSNFLRVVYNYSHEQTRRARCSPSCRPEVFAACPQRL